MQIEDSPFFDYERHQKYILTGKYIDHPKYGFQFSILTVEKYLPSQKEEILSFLKSNAFKGIGKKTAEKIYDYFGNDTLTILKDVLPLKYVIWGRHFDFCFSRFKAH